MKKTFLILMLLVCVLALNACVGLQQNTSAGGSTTTGDVTLQVPDFADEAYLWSATAEAGKTQLSSNYRIIVKEGSSASSIASQVLSLTTGMNFITTNDKIDNNPERANEILLGYITNRDASGAIFEEYQEQFDAYTQGVGSFFIGANGSKIMILAADEASISAAVKFFVTHYVNDKEVVEIESDLRSIYFFDKIEYSKSSTVVCSKLNPDFGETEVKVIGTRHGEKLYETLVTREEMAKAIDMGNYYRIPCDNRDLNYDKFFTEGNEDMTKIEDYHSHNTGRLDVEGMKEQLMRLRFIQEDLGLLPRAKARDIRSE